MNSVNRSPDSQRLGTTLLGVAIAAVLISRAYLLSSQDFAVNDGGLFLAFVEAIAGTFPALPREVGYNGLQIPFAYPPLSFWIAALLTRLGFDGIELVRAMPILMNIVYVLLFALLLLKSGRSRLFVGLALLFFMVALRSFEWLLMGGGLSRGMGSVFLILSLLAISVPDHARRADVSWKRAALAGAFAGGAILSHLEWGILAAASIVLSRALGSTSIRQFIIACAVSGATALALVLPWLLFIHFAHGLGPLMSAGSSSGWSAKAPVVRMIEFAVVAGMANPLVLLGGAVLVAKKEWFWPAFLLTCAVLTPRHALTPQMLAMAVFAARGSVSAYRFASRFVRSKNLLRAASAGTLGVLLVYGASVAHRDASNSFRVLPQEAREAMTWVSVHAPGRRFAIISGHSWQADSSAEWFPILSSATSVTTVQGREWTGEYLRWHNLSEQLRESRSCGELHSNLARIGTFDLVWAEVMHECFTSPAHRLVFRNARVRIYEPAAR